MSEMFGRQVIVEIGEAGGVGRRFKNLRIGGRIEKSPKSGPNTAVLEIYNPAPDSIAAAQNPRAVVRVLAGHDVPRLLFVGTIIKNGARIEQAGPDRILTIEAMDGGRSYQEAHINESFSRTSTMEQVFGALAAKLGVQLGAVSPGESMQFPRGLTLAGPVRSVLDDLASSLGAEWSIQDGALQVLSDDEDTGEAVVRVSSRTGNLIGTPKIGSDGLEITALLDGRLRPGRRLVIESKQFEGVYRASEVQHIFDSGWDSSFHTVVVAKEVK